MKASVGLIRATRSTPFIAGVGAVLSLVLLYLGTQPIRVAIGWWVRVETALGLPEVLPTAGAPGLPAIGGMRLAFAFAPALVLVGMVIALGRGVRGSDTPPERPETKPEPTAASDRPESSLRGRARALIAPLASVSKPLTDLLDRARALGVGFGIAAVLEVATLLLAGRIVVLAARAGFL
jgi:hypothetical protein